MRTVPGTISVAAAIVLSLGPLSSIAGAEDTNSAAALFRAAESAYARRDFKAAAVAFEEADRKDPRAATLYNAGLAWQSADEPARAADALAIALARADLDPTRREDAERRLKALLPTLGLIQIRGPSGEVTVAHVTASSVPRDVHVAPGEHEVLLRRVDGTTLKKVMVVEAGATAVLEFEDSGGGREGPRVAAKARTHAQKGRGPEGVRRAEPEQERRAGDGGQAQRTWGFVALGGAALLGGVTAYLGVSALSARDDFEKNPSSADARDRAARLETWTNVALAGAAVLGVTGVVVIVTASSSESGSESVLGVTGRF